jgi:hypothetical protein
MNEGSWIKGERYGKGVLKYPDGRVKYEGNWKDDLFSGDGCLYHFEKLKVNGI